MPRGLPPQEPTGAHGWWRWLLIPVLFAVSGLAVLFMRLADFVDNSKFVPVPRPGPVLKKGRAPVLKSSLPLNATNWTPYRIHAQPLPILPEQCKGYVTINPDTAGLGHSQVRACVV